MNTATFASLCVTLSAMTMAAPGLAQPAAQRPAQTPAGDARTPAPPVMLPQTPPQAAAMNRRPDRAALPQGFSVVLVLGDIQGAPTADDVPPAARKALTDMRDFLPFKSYKLLDAAWVMCCGQLPETLTQVLRGPEDQEYELKLSTSRGGGAQVFVRFALSSGGTPDVTHESPAATARTLTRKIADLRDRRMLLEKQIQEARKKVDIGIAPGGDIAKLELDLRRVEREIQDLSAQLSETRGGRSATPSPNVRRFVHGAMIDTSFAMDVGETVVVGTSRLKGGSRALIALLTAVPPRGTERRE
jgi:hypothetical protein